jgi:hypothetical protein
MTHLMAFLQTPAGVILQVAIIVVSVAGLLIASKRG